MRQIEEDYQRFQQTPLPEAVPAPLCELFRDLSHRLPELWPLLGNAHKKELLRALISHVIIRRPVPDQIVVRIVWVSGYYSDHCTQTPIHRQVEVSNYDKMVEQLHRLWQQGYSDEHIAQQLTDEGFHSARSSDVKVITVMKIRLAHQWYTPFEQMRGCEEVNDYLTVRGLAKRLQVDDSTIYRSLHNHVIPAEYLLHDSQTARYLIRNDTQLIEQLRQQISDHKRKNGLLPAARSK